MGKWNGRISKQLAMSFNHFWSNIPILVNLIFTRWNQDEMKWVATITNDRLHIQIQLIVLIVYIFKVSLMSMFSKSADCLRFQSQLIVYISKVSWLFTFLKSADCLHFQSQLIAYCICKELIVLSRFCLKAEWMKNTSKFSKVRNTKTKQINVQRNAPSKWFQLIMNFPPTYADFAD